MGDLRAVIFDWGGTLTPWHTVDLAEFHDDREATVADANLLLAQERGTGVLQALGHEAVVAVGRRLLVMGGRTAPHTVTDRMWWFTPASRRWVPAGRLPYPVADASRRWVHGTQVVATFALGRPRRSFASAMRIS